MKIRAILYLVISIFISFNANAQTWNSPVTIPDPSLTTGGNIGEYNSLVVVNGNPAIAARNVTNNTLIYLRASDASGTSWSSPVTLDASGTVGEYASLFVVDGNPAVAYFDLSNGALKYVRATNVNGTAWGSPVTVHDIANVVGRYISLRVVNGNPAIAYQDATAGTVKFVRASDASGTTWGTKQTIATGGGSGYFNSMEIVNGNPAIAYNANSNGDLMYIRATDASGTTWGSAVTVDNTGGASVGNYATLEVINGYPAIAYHDFTSKDLKYVRATNADGSAWGSLQTLETTGEVATSYMTLLTVNGYPAISFYDKTNGDLKFIRATDADGTTWAASTAIDATGDVGQYASMEIINGNPAIAYYDFTNGNIKYIRASNTDGSAWNTALSFDAGTAVGTYTGFQLVSSNPALSFYSATPGDLKYVRATNTTGSSWGSMVTVDATGDVGQYTSMAIVNGNPAIAYYDVTNGDLKYVRALDATGSSWDTPLTIESSGNVGQYTSMIIVNGNPAIAYYDVTNADLKYVRALDASGTTWDTPLTIDASANNVGQYASMVVVNGKPAVAYYDATGADLKYVQASNANGSGWNAAITVESTNSVGSYARLAVVNGNPAIAYYSSTGTLLKYIRASDADGTSWSGSVTAASGTNSINHISFAVVNGRPAIIYNDFPSLTGPILKYVRATNANGTAWGSTTSIDAAAAQFPNLIYSGTNVYIGYYQRGSQLPALLYGQVTSFEWTGGASTTDWFTTSNWEGSVIPTSEYSASIPAGLSFYPDISSGTASCKNITIANGATTTVSGTGELQIAGSISNSGTFTATAGTITLNGTSAQTIPASAFAGNTIKNLTLNNSSGATLAGTLNVSGTYTPTSGTLTTGGFLVLKSDVNGTARVAAGTGSYISGNVTVERYIPAKRAWRLLTAPLTGSSNNSIFYNWQNNDNVIANTGVELWTMSANGGTSDPSSANSGLAVASGNSILAYTSGVGWNAVTNTNTTNLFNSTDNNGFCVYVTGPYGNGSGNINNGATATVLKATGTLRTGNVTVSAGTLAANQYYLVGNPYASPVDPNTLSGTNLSNSFCMWDPNLTGNYGVGRYVTYNRTLNQYNVTSASYSNSPVSQIQSGQAFFIHSAGAGATDITFEEADKTSTVNNNQFKTTSGFENLRITLQRDFSSNNYLNADAAVACFHSSIGSKSIDYYDVIKLNNGSDNLALMRSGTALTFEHRPLVTDKDTLYLRLSSTSVANYRMIISPEDFATMSGLIAVLKDNYTNTETNINLAGSTTIDFNITSNAATTGDRFIIYFRSTPVLPVDFINVNALAEGSSVKIRWNVSTEKNVLKYDIERSKDGSSFTRIGSVNATGAASYNWNDANPFADINFYRIRSIDVNGNTKLSPVVKLKMNLIKEYTVHPNPVSGRSFELRMNNAAAGDYTVQMVNAVGQIVYTTRFYYSNGASAQQITLPKNIQPGTYQATISNGEEVKTLSLIIL